MAQRSKAPITNALNLNVFIKRTANRRAVPDQENVEYFVDKHGMPFAEAVRNIVHHAWDKPSQPTPAYDKWMTEKSHHAYLTFLRSHPKWVYNEYVQSRWVYRANGQWMLRIYDEWRNAFRQVGLAQVPQL